MQRIVDINLLDNIRSNAKLVVTVGTTAAIGALVLLRVFGSGSSRRRKKHSPGSGPTGNGKWKLYHVHTFRSARCLFLIEGIDLGNLLIANFIIYQFNLQQEI